jgi:hypothetical protein
MMIATWMLTGLVCAWVKAEPGQSRLAWAPMAIVLGPLWLKVATEQVDDLNPQTVPS